MFSPIDLKTDSESLPMTVISDKSFNQ